MCIECLQQRVGDATGVQGQAASIMELYHTRRVLIVPLC